MWVGVLFPPHTPGRTGITRPPRAWINAQAQVTEARCFAWLAGSTQRHKHAYCLDADLVCVGHGRGGTLRGAHLISACAVRSSDRSGTAAHGACCKSALVTCATARRRIAIVRFGCPGPQDRPAGRATMSVSAAVLQHHNGWVFGYCSGSRPEARRRRASGAASGPLYSGARVVATNEGAHRVGRAGVCKADSNLSLQHYVLKHRPVLGSKADRSTHCTLSTT